MTDAKKAPKYGPYEESTNTQSQLPQYYIFLTCYAYKKDGYKKKLSEEPNRTEAVDLYFKKTLDQKLGVLQDALKKIGEVNVSYDIQQKYQEKAIKDLNLLQVYNLFLHEIQVYKNMLKETELRKKRNAQHVEKAQPVHHKNFKEHLFKHGSNVPSTTKFLGWLGNEIDLLSGKVEKVVVPPSKKEKVARDEDSGESFEELEQENPNRGQKVAKTSDEAGVPQVLNKKEEKKKDNQQKQNSKDKVTKEKPKTTVRKLTLEKDTGKQPQKSSTPIKSIQIYPTLANINFGFNDSANQNKKTNYYKVSFRAVQCLIQLMTSLEHRFGIGASLFDQNSATDQNGTEEFTVKIFGSPDQAVILDLRKNDLTKQFDFTPEGYMLNDLFFYPDESYKKNFVVALVKDLSNENELVQTLLCIRTMFLYEIGFSGALIVLKEFENYDAFLPGDYVHLSTGKTFYGDIIPGFSRNFFVNDQEQLFESSLLFASQQISIQQLTLSSQEQLAISVWDYSVKTESNPKNLPVHLALDLLAQKFFLGALQEKLKSQSSYDRFLKDHCSRDNETTQNLMSNLITQYKLIESAGRQSKPNLVNKFKSSTGNKFKNYDLKAQYHKSKKSPLKQDQLILNQSTVDVSAKATSEDDSGSKNKAAQLEQLLNHFETNNRDDTDLIRDDTQLEDEYRNKNDLDMLDSQEALINDQENLVSNQDEDKQLEEYLLQQSNIQNDVDSTHQNLSLPQDNTQNQLNSTILESSQEVAEEFFIKKLYEILNKEPPSDPEQQQLGYDLIHLRFFDTCIYQACTRKLSRREGMACEICWIIACSEHFPEERTKSQDCQGCSGNSRTEDFYNDCYNQRLDLLTYFSAVILKNWRSEEGYKQVFAKLKSFLESNSHQLIYEKELIQEKIQAEQAIQSNALQQAQVVQDPQYSSEIQALYAQSSFKDIYGLPIAAFAQYLDQHPDDQQNVSEIEQFEVVKFFKNTNYKFELSEGIWKNFFNKDRSRDKSFIEYSKKQQELEKERANRAKELEEQKAKEAKAKEEKIQELKSATPVKSFLQKEMQELPGWSGTSFAKKKVENLQIGTQGQEKLIQFQSQNDTYIEPYYQSPQYSQNQLSTVAQKLALDNQDPQHKTPSKNQQLQQSIQKQQQKFQQQSSQAQETLSLKKSQSSQNLLAASKSEKPNQKDVNMNNDQKEVNMNLSVKSQRNEESTSKGQALSSNVLNSNVKAQDLQKKPATQAQSYEAYKEVLVTFVYQCSNLTKQSKQEFAAQIRRGEQGIISTVEQAIKNQKAKMDQEKLKKQQK